MAENRSNGNRPPHAATLPRQKSAVQAKMGDEGLGARSPHAAIAVQPQTSLLKAEDARRPPHPATVVQPQKAHPANAAKPQHPTVSAQLKRHDSATPQDIGAARKLPPHVATVAQAKNPHPATGVVQRMDINIEQNTSQTDINRFVIKSEESQQNDPVDRRSYSESHRYGLRYPTEVYLPNAGGDPTVKRKKNEESGYYYHVTSFANLSGISVNGLNPDAGGKVGGSSFQNSDKEMNEKSSKESRGKVYVAVHSKLVERYLSFRLRMDDLLGGKHREFIISTVCQHMDPESKFKNLSKTLEGMLDRLLFGEMPVVLRFKNCWEPDCWEHDPVEKKAFALVGQAVAPELIECLTSEGWVSVSAMTEIAVVYAPNVPEKKFRRGLLNFYGDFNEALENMSQFEAYQLAEDLIERLDAEELFKK